MTRGGDDMVYDPNFLHGSCSLMVMEAVLILGPSQESW